MEDDQKESHKKNRRNYVKANLIDMKFLNETKWKEMKEPKDKQKKYDFFTKCI